MSRALQWSLSSFVGNIMATVPQNSLQVEFHITDAQSLNAIMNIVIHTSSEEINNYPSHPHQISPVSLSWTWIRTSTSTLSRPDPSADRIDSNMSPSGWQIELLARKLSRRS